VPHLQQLHALYTVLRRAREERGAIDFETVETRIVFNEARKIDAIVPVQRNDAHKLIEECMLCANVAAARFFERHALPVLYRVHEGPSAEKLENLRAYLGELGLGLRGGATPTPHDYQRLLAQIADPGRAHRADHAAALAQPGGLPGREPGSLWPELPRLRALYVADTPLSGSARAPGDPQRDPVRVRSKLVQRVRGAGELERRRIYPYDEAAMVRLRRALLDDRASRRRRDARGARPG
jgi:ribonuclease R